ncbi:MAG: YdcF family protein [Ruminococcus sp.]|nr:YdcF family protein [Ruminococcus sp.]
MSRCLFRDFFQNLKIKFLKKQSTKIIWRICQTGFALFIIYALIISSAMIYFSSIPPEKGATSITLGAKVHHNGSPSKAIDDRTKTCYHYLKANPTTLAILSGGQGSDEGVSEADYMYNTLLKKGINPDRLIKEDKSTTTEENIRNSYKLIKENDLSENIAITTDSYHQLRARIIAKKQDIKGSIGAVNAKTYLWIYPTYFVREWFAIPYEIIK